MNCLIGEYGHFMIDIYNVLRHPGGTAGGSAGTAGLVSAGSSLLRARALVSEPRRRGPVLPGLPGPVPHDLRVDGAAHAVTELGVQLRQLVAGVDARLRDVTNRRGLHNVANDEFLDGLVLGHALGAVGATHGLHVAAPVLVATVIPALRSHLL